MTGSQSFGMGLPCYEKVLNEMSRMLSDSPQGYSFIKSCVPGNAQNSEADHSVTMSGISQILLWSGNPDTQL